MFYEDNNTAKLLEIDAFKRKFGSGSVLDSVSLNASSLVSGIVLPLATV